MRNFAFVVVSLFAVQAWSQTTTTTIPAGEVQNQDAVVAPASPEGTSTTNVGKPEEAKKKTVEKVIVTGSHIKRIDVEGASPVQTITRKDLEKTGYNSVADVLRDTTASSFGSVREDSGSSTAGNANVDLRGLGADRTLVLLNGQRLPSDAVDGAVDLNLIPMAAVERIDVLKDGASATYGSDALGGVINIVTRKDFVGNEISLSQTIPQQPGGKRQDISLVNGVEIGKANMVTVVQYRDNEKVYSRDRFFTSQGTSNFGSPGSFKDKAPGAKWNPAADCPEQYKQPGLGGVVCKFPYPQYSTELPAIQQLSLLSETTIPVGSRVTMRTRLGGTQKKTQWSFAPSPLTTLDDVTIPAAIADGMNIPGHVAGNDVQAVYRTLELGTRDADNTSRSYNMLLGSTVDVGAGWEVDVSTAYNRVRTMDKGVSGYGLTSGLIQAIEEGRYNLTAPAGQRGNIEGIRYQPWEKMTSELTSLDVKATGPIAELPAGDMQIAVGASYTFQKFKDEFDEVSISGDVFGNAGSSGGGQRDTRAVFTEITTPITQKVELQLAGRYDEYSDFGSTVNPKVGVLYRPTKSLLLRSSVGTGFKAPNMQDLYAATSDGNPTFIDQKACEMERAQGGATPSCEAGQWNVRTSGNQGLKEERSISYNVGAMYEPNKDFNIGSDLFLIKMNNVVGIDYEDVTIAEMNGVDLSQYNVSVQRDADGYIETINAPIQNLSNREVYGIDMTAAYRMGMFRLSTDHSHLFWFKEKGFPGFPEKDKLGENGYPAWRNSTALAFYPTERNELAVSANTIAGQEKDREGFGMLPNYTTYNLTYSYRMKKFGTISAGIYNLAGSTPPIDTTNNNQPLNITLYDQIGRQYYTGYKATF